MLVYGKFTTIFFKRQLHFFCLRTFSSSSVNIRKFVQFHASSPRIHRFIWNFFYPQYYPGFTCFNKVREKNELYCQDLFAVLMCFLFFFWLFVQSYQLEPVYNRFASESFSVLTQKLCHLGVCHKGWFSVAIFFHFPTFRHFSARFTLHWNVVEEQNSPHGNFCHSR